MSAPARSPLTLSLAAAALLLASACTSPRPSDGGAHVPVLRATGQPSQDLNGNGVEDWLDLAVGTSVDLDGNGIPDEAEPS